MTNKTLTAEQETAVQQLQALLSAPEPDPHLLHPIDFIHVATQRAEWKKELADILGS